MIHKACFSFPVPLWVITFFQGIAGQQALQNGSSKHVLFFFARVIDAFRQRIFLKVLGNSCFEIIFPSFNAETLYKLLFSHTKHQMRHFLAQKCFHNKIE